MVDADEALDLDILLELVEPEELMPHTLKLASQIAANPPHTVRLTKRLLRHARRMDLDEFLDMTAAYQAIAHTEPTHHEAVRRYVEDMTNGSSS